jgi:DNA helicase-2/ATP-dependent DNA helicase PcrA
VRFLLSAEISTIYRGGDRTRKVHHLIYAPTFESADRITGALAKIGNLASDGRPIIGLPSRDLLEITLAGGPGCYLVPAHVWTPWFAVLGSKSGFDLVADCYGDLAGEVFAIETGRSSDPPMNWICSALDGYRLVSNSDAHSPPMLGREATTLSCDLDYFAMARAFRTGAGLAGTLEFFPEEGKYHLDGHRTCGIRLDPDDSRARGGICPPALARLRRGAVTREGGYDGEYGTVRLFAPGELDPRTALFELPAHLTRAGLPFRKGSHDLLNGRAGVAQILAELQRDAPPPGRPRRGEPGPEPAAPAVAALVAAAAR